MSEHLERQLREAFEQRAAALPPDAYERLQDTDYHPRSPLHRVGMGLAGLAALIAAAAVSLSIIGFGGGGTQRAFAGWVPVPSAAAPGQTPAAEAACRTTVSKQPQLPPLTKPGPLRVLLADTRGPYTMVLVTDGNTDSNCLVGPWPSPSTVGVSGSSPSAITIKVPPDQIGAFSIGLTRAENEQPFTHTEGRVGSVVSAVRFVLANGKRVSATIGKGWYLAWWPAQRALAIEVVASGHTTVHQLKRLRS
jgi:hypothetical protein